ncbi:MAG: hypothetical protein ACREX3_00405 [Gammaproteobacteria bacterium]
MPRVCTVCRHADRTAIDEALLAGEPLRDIARRVAVSKDALARHKADHLPAHLARAAEAEKAADATSLLGQMHALQAKTLAILEAAKDPRTALTAVREARGNLELLAELTGKLAHQPTVNVLVSNEWVTLRSAVLDALLSFPEARAAVSARLLALEAGGDGGQ